MPNARCVGNHSNPTKCTGTLPLSCTPWWSAQARGKSPSPAAAGTRQSSGGCTLAAAPPQSCSPAPGTNHQKSDQQLAICDWDDIYQRAYCVREVPVASRFTVTLSQAPKGKCALKRLRTVKALRCIRARCHPQLGVPGYETSAHDVGLGNAVAQSARDNLTCQGTITGSTGNPHCQNSMATAIMLSVPNLHPPLEGPCVLHGRRSQM